MVVGAFPAVKLAVLLFKQISKPIANFAKERAKNNRFFRTYVCMPPAHFYNWCEVKSKMWIMNLGKPVNIPQMNEQMAIELGANLLGEGIIFILGSAVLILEYNRSSNKEAIKEEQRVQEMDHLNTTIRDLYFAVQKQDTQMREMERTIWDLESRVVVKPWVQKKEDKNLNPPPPSDPPTSPPPTMNLSSNMSIPPPADVKKLDSSINPSTPYPERGVISRSLNYIELVVLNTPQPVEIQPQVEEPPAKPNVYKRKHSLVTEALKYIEHDVKGLL